MKRSLRVRASLNFLSAAATVALSACSRNPGAPAFTPAEQAMPARGGAYEASAAMAYEVLHRFGGSPDGYTPSAGLTNVNGVLYGTASSGGGPANGGVVFRTNPNGRGRILYAFKAGGDGADPDAGVIEVNGTLYGTTALGGTYQKGTVYSLTLNGSEKVLHSFAGGTDGEQPHAALIEANGTLYGTTEYGGG
ncbi:MAG: hypothetical protein JO030_01850, partial [Candidatus Eremiobacteraeota bacterium]|nr:hypothetical protein [Candidatus Eremiobacteraeota bacterium]